MSDTVKKLILHGDDAGLCGAANEGIIQGLEEGILTSASVMIPCRAAKEMAAYGRTHPSYDVGVHVTLTSEWESYRWGPVADPSDVPSLMDEEGFLWRDERLVARHADPAEVEIELRAQIEAARAWGLKPTHMDSHMGALFTQPAIVEVFYGVAVETGIPPLLADLSEEEIREINPDLQVGSLQAVEALKAVFPVLQSFTPIQSGSLAEKRGQLLGAVEAMPPGLHEIILHPASPTEELKSITPSAADRGRDLALLLDRETRERLEATGTVRTNWIEAAHDSTNL